MPSNLELAKAHKFNSCSTYLSMVCKASKPLDLIWKRRMGIRGDAVFVCINQPTCQEHVREEHISKPAWKKLRLGETEREREREREREWRERRERRGRDPFLHVHHPLGPFIKAGPPLDLSFWSFLTFLHHGIEEVERHLL